MRIDVDQLLKEREEERSDPAHSTSTNLSTKVVAGADSQDDALSPPLKPSSRKRKLDGDVSTRGKKKLKVSDLKSGAASSAVFSAKAQPKITLKLGPRSEEQESFPCCLCVSTSREGLLRVQNPPFARKDASEAAGHPKVWLAHEFCANVVPETWVDNFFRPDGSVEKVVYGVDGIVKDRWNLVRLFIPRSTKFLLYMVFLTYFFLVNRNVPRVPRLDRKCTVHRCSAQKASARRRSTLIVQTMVTPKVFCLVSCGKWIRKSFHSITSLFRPSLALRR